MSSPDHHDLEVPTTSGRHFLVEFPGYVRSEERALRTFGGPTGLSAQRQAHARNLQLRLRPDDPYCHALVSDDAKPAKFLVVKLSRPWQPPAGSSTSKGPGAAFQATVVAAVDQVYRFSSPADFQYVGRDLRPPQEQLALRTPSAVDSPIALPLQPLLCSPPAFAVEGLEDYSLRQYRAADHGLDGVKPQAAKLRSNVVLLDYFTTNVPAAPATPPAVAESERAGLEVVQALLQRRPVLLPLALESQLLGGGEGGNGEGGSAARLPSQSLLAGLCYKFRNGPWQGAWVRKGYDPRKNPEARQYQVLQYTLPVTWYARLAQHPQAAAAAAAAHGGRPTPAFPLPATSYPQLCTFAALPGTSAVQLQLCDLQDPAIQAILAASGPSALEPAPNDATGWMPQLPWEAVKMQVQQRFQALIDQLPHPSAAAAAAAAAGGAVTSGLARMDVDDSSAAAPPAPKAAKSAAKSAAVDAAAAAARRGLVLPPELIQHIAEHLQRLPSQRLQEVVGPPAEEEEEEEGEEGEAEEDGSSQEEREEEEEEEEEEGYRGG